MAVIDVAEYCRAIEAHLCRRNEGHLIRIVGPSFEVVRGWAEQGIPLSVAMAGVDRHVERQQAKGPRRRPVRIEFCEADVLDVFDGWRRAVGIAAPTSPGPRRDARHGAHVTPEDEADAEVEPASVPRRRLSLAAHVERVQARLTVLRGSDPSLAGLSPALDEAVRALDGLLAEARRARGDAREAVIARLAALDAALGRAARDVSPPAEVERMRAEAGRELAPFRERMDEAAYTRALDAEVERAIRHRHGLPRLSFD